MISKRLFQRWRGGDAGPGFPWIAVFVLFLCACGDGDTPVSSAPLVPLSPVVPVAPVAPVVANAVSVVAPTDAEILAYIGQTRIITLAFRSNQGSASNLTLSLPTLPGLRAAGEALHCAAVDTADACRVQISYTATAPAPSSSAQFSYAYTDSAGTSREGTYTLAYRVLPANTVVVSQQPGGVLRGIVGRSLPVTLAFETGDGEAAASLKMTSDLAGLPTGWKSDQAGFSCASLGRSQGCRLSLSYNPVAPESGSRLALAYSYIDSSGVARSGLANVDYAAVLPGSVVASLDASGALLVRPGESKEITVRFTASDGGRASALRLSTDLSNSPGWSIAPGWQGCAVVEGGDSCRLALVFAPASVVGPSALALSYTYVDNVGEARSGSLEIDYASRLYEAYIADYSDDASGGVRSCTMDADGGLSNCAAALVDLPGNGRNISHIVASGRQAYVSSLASGDRSSVFLCAIAADGALKACRETGGIKAGIRHLSLRGASAYLLTGDGKVLRQDLDVASGEIRPCPANRGDCVSAGADSPIAALGFVGTKAYIVRPGSDPRNVEAIQCGITPAGDLDCSGPAFLSDYYFAAGALATWQDGPASRLYIVGEPNFALLDGASAVIACGLAADGTIAGCASRGVAVLSSTVSGEAALFRDMVFDGTHAYIVQEANIYRCDISTSDGTLPNCDPLSGTGAARHFALSINRIR